jgi:tetratricopeptide (TPR) repeat protein
MAGDANPAQVDRDGKKLSKRLKGDLDNIVLMALRKEPQRRYASVERFADDIRRHLENLPVIARKDTVAYRTSKFVRRHRSGIAATAIMVVALLIGLGITLNEKRRADRRFNDVRSLANSLLFEIHDSIRDLPGSTPARKLLVDRALQYLDSLSAEGGNDPSLSRELATAYERVGTVQGNPFGANLGDIQGALESYRKSLAIRELLSKAAPSNVDDQVALARGHRLIAAVLDNQNDTLPATLAAIKEAVAIAERALQLSPYSLAAREELRADYLVSGARLDGVGDYQAALQYHWKALPIAEQLSEVAPDQRSAKDQLGRVEGRIAVDLARLGYRTEALDHLGRGRQIFESLAAGGTDAEARRILGAAHYRLGEIFFMNGDVSGALQQYRKYLAGIESLAKVDPANAVIQYDLANAHATVGNALFVSGNRAGGMIELNLAAKMFQSQIYRDPAYKEPRWGLGVTRIWIGEAFENAGDTAASLKNYEQGLAIWEGIAAHKEGTVLQATVAEIHEKIGSVYARMGNYDQALQEFKGALEMVEPMMAAHPNIVNAKYVVADAYSGLGDLSQKSASDVRRPRQKQIQDWSEARVYYLSSLDTWKRIHNPGERTPLLGLACGDPKKVEEQIVKCDGAITRLRPSSPPSDAVVAR